LRGHYHLPGDANLRGYYGENLVGSESVITNSFELFFNPGLKVINIELAAFIDDGWIWGSKFTQGDGGFKGDYLLDAGLGMRMKKSIFGKEFTIRIDVPLMVKDISSEKNGYQFRSDKWLFSFSKGI
jgi:outer membrane protein assembly factor BamA